MIKFIGSIFISLVFMTLAFSHAALSNEPAPGVLEACETEITSYCEKVNPGNGRLFACMYAHEDQLSAQCANSIDDFADAMDLLFANANEALAICAPDIETQCSEVDMGGGRILTCLKENQANVSTGCQEVIEAFGEQYGVN
ncbi:Cysteine rich repeat protein [Pseudovibrio axinellae]|uniref:Cysteine rich repeat protein n=1 Tax=Pseudovibrio axinellae TaxID=989403 RepID=A0A165YTT9_9HYPH|nr:cysteine rich repeat-containing protein [Pseudovibrio axinellae]KZL19228.1 Cysteine rich repeat protein [Pseudovibrio axinellae]SEQ45107.1 Cysteine rich repeat-containing protein [Pseudovibrio axinellae]